MLHVTTEQKHVRYIVTIVESQNKSIFYNKRKSNRKIIIWKMMMKFFTCETSSKNFNFFDHK